MAKTILGKLATVKITRVVQTDIDNSYKYPDPEGSDLDLWCDVCNDESIMLPSDNVWIIDIAGKTAHVCSLSCAEKWIKWGEACLSI